MQGKIKEESNVYACDYRKNLVIGCNEKVILGY
jgi:hypothetical protein